MRITPVLSCLLLTAIAAAQDPRIRLPRQPRVSPNGELVAFTWQGDLWTAPTRGGAATRLTIHPADDSSPFFDSSGEHIAFLSERSGRSQVHVIHATGGASRQLTHDSHSKSLLGFTGDGTGILVSQSTDRTWTRGESNRLWLVDLQGRTPKRALFDTGFAEAVLSPDGTRILFTRGRAGWNRKGYRGPSAPQLWLANLTESPPGLTRLSEDLPRFQNVSILNPMWAPDGAGYYYVSDPDGTFDVYYRNLDGSGERRLTQVGAEDHSDDGVAFPSLSGDGEAMIFRRRFDLHRLDLADGSVTKIDIAVGGDGVASAEERRSESSTNGVAFTDDGKQMAFVAGGDVYVMDRILKEPVRVTDTPHQESSVVFGADGERIFFVSDTGGEVDVWEATHEQEDGIWWLAKSFTLRQITDDRAVESGLRPGPNGEHVAYVKGTDLFVMKADGTEHRRVVETWSPPDFDWSPDGKWLAYSTQDSDYNSDVWIVPLDGTREPFNLSRHPDGDSNPAWSRDGTRIAFVSRRDGEESDIYYVNLTKEEEEQTERDRKLEEALEEMKRSGPPKRDGKSARGSGRGDRGRGGRPEPGAEPQEPAEPAEDEEEDDDEAEEPEEEEEEEPLEVTIDFDDILDRIHRIAIPDSRESGLLWSPDGEKLAFSATIDGERGFFTVEFPDVEEPKRMAASGLGSARWLEETKEIVGISRPRESGSERGRFRGFGGGGGTPAAMSERGEVETFGFGVRHVRDWRALRQIAFDQGWRAMRDHFYDPSLNNRDWEAIRGKYRPVAAQCIGADEFSELMNMMLGELNASHMGHRGGSDPLPDHTAQNAWTPTTYHLGLRFVRGGEGPGLVVESVIPGSPCHRERSHVAPGETLVAIEGEAVGPDVDLDRILTMDEPRDLVLTVRDGEGEEREVTVRAMSSVQGLLYDEWTENTRLAVEEQSDGTLGYLHIRGMNMSSFRQMEEDLYHAGHGKEGLIIDVRFNGGGSTADHVLTALTQPVHAITKSRGSGEGYPQDRRIYASWGKPIVVMCNEYSFSNAEILAHAVKQIGRGRVVGMRTGGGVISTGMVRLLDGSSVRMPGRGWYLTTTGEDMEMNGCEPDIALWNPPGGEDLQLRAAVGALLEDVAAEKARGGVEIESAADKRRREGDD